MFISRLLTVLIKHALLISRHGHFVLTTWSTTLLLIHKLLFSTSTKHLTVVQAWANVLTRIRDLLVSHHLCLATLSNHANNGALTCRLSWLVIRSVVGRWGSYNTSIFVLRIHTFLILLLKSIGSVILTVLLFTIYRYLVSKYILCSSFWMMTCLYLFKKALTIYIKIIIRKKFKDFQFINL